MAKAVLKGSAQLRAALKELAKKVAEPATLKVGFFEGSTEADGTSVPMLAAIHNYGAPKVGIPPRPFFSNMVRDNQKGWPDVLAEALKKSDYDAKEALALLGEEMEGELRASIIGGHFKPLKPRTLQRRGVDPKMKYDPKNPKTFGAKPLVRTGTMLASIKSVVE